MDLEQGHEAEVHDGSQPGILHARVRVLAGGVRVTAPDGSSETWGFTELTMVRGQSRGEPVQLERRSQPVQVVIVHAPAFREELLAALPRGTRLRGSGGVARPLRPSSP